IDEQSKADALAEATDAHRHFNDDVVDVNRGLARAYREIGRPAPPPTPFDDAPPAGFVPARVSSDVF
ncbi:MAG: hypothetical protein ABMA64_39740, partial [Myxococcota bacterium]